MCSRRVELLSFIAKAVPMEDEFMMGNRKEDDGGYEERALDRLRMVTSSASALEGRDPGEVRRRLQNTMSGGSRRSSDRDVL